MKIEPESLELLATALESLGYVQFSAPGDRHGSWEWPFYKVSGGLTRFVIFAATPMDGRGTLQVEIWIGAQADGGYVRQLVHLRRMMEGELGGSIGDLADPVRQAARKANSLDSSDLVSAPLSTAVREDLGFSRAPRVARG